MRRCTGMAACAGIRPGPPAARTSPSTWATGREYRAGRFAPAAGVHVPRAATTTMRSDLFRVWLAEGMDARLAAFVHRAAPLPVRADGWRAPLSVGMAVRSDAFVQRAVAVVTTQLAVGRDRVAAGMFGRAEAFAMARGGCHPMSGCRVTAWRRAWRHAPGP